MPRLSFAAEDGPDGRDGPVARAGVQLPALLAIDSECDETLNEIPA